MIKVTFTLASNLTDTFYEGHGDSIKGLNNLTDREKLDYLIKCAKGDMSHWVKMKIGTGQFSQAVEFNSMIRRTNLQIDFELGNRRGYKLATFYVS